MRIQLGKDIRDRVVDPLQPDMLLLAQSVARLLWRRLYNDATWGPWITIYDTAIQMAEVHVED